MLRKLILFELLLVAATVAFGENVTVESTHQHHATNELNEPYLNKQFANETNSYSAHYQPKLLLAGGGNNTLVNSQARTVAVSGTGSDVKANPTAATNTTSLILILVSLVVITCVILLIITALFIMRRRFSIWRLNNSKLNLNGDNGAAGGSENAEEESESKQDTGSGSDTVKSNETAAAPICDEKEQPTIATLENKQQSVIDLEAAASAAPPPPPPPVEAKCHMNEAVETGETKPSTTDAHVLTSEHVSSTSLIVNVLNELSESVAKGLATKSPTSRSSLTANDPEKQPLKE